MKKIFFAFIILGAAFSSCTKGNEADQEEVWVRVENATTAIFDNTQVSDVDYSTIASGGQTEYKLISLPVYAAGCSFKINNQPGYAGVLICGTPPPPEFEPGYYTYKILPDPAQPYYLIDVTKR